MGLFDSVVSAVSHQIEQQGGLAQVVSGLLANNGELGGLNGLVEKFNQAGLGDVVNSWIGQGANQAISADQLTGVLGNDFLTQAAGKLGLDATQLSSQLSQFLPGVVDQLTPQGSLPAAGAGNAGDLLGLLGGLLPQR